MIYDYQYDIAAILFTSLLFIIFQIRRSYITKSNSIFMAVIICNLLASVFDGISCYTISYPERCSVAFNYFVSLGYLLCFNTLSVLFFLYIDSKAKLAKNEVPAQVAAAVMILYYMVIILSSPWTHWVAYFEGTEYLHGPLMSSLFILPFAIFFWEIALFIIARNRFNKYQVTASIALILGMGISVAVQAMVTRLLIGQMTSAIILFFAYITFENPAYYTFEDTQCLNRRAFYETVKKQIWKKERFSLLAFSINDFEYYRHSMGAHQLKQLSAKIADFLYQNFRKDAYVLADDKFVVFLPHASNADEYLRTIKSFFKKPIQLKRREIMVNASYCTMADLDNRFTADEIETVVEYRLNNPSMSLESNYLLQEVLEQRFRREKILHIIKRALQNDEFKVYFQPIFSVASGHFDSAEALIRLQDKELGFINPEEMITIAEENGYIEQIGAVVFRKVCAFIRDYNPMQYGVKYIEVNLSPVQCVQENLCESYLSILREYGIEPHLINLEITETAQTEKNHQLIRNMNLLNEKGMEFSIDDYGSGFATANYLIDLPVSIVKIDKSILWPAMKEQRAMVVLQNTIHMLKELGKKIVVEGVETKEMVDVLVACNCDYLQGFYYSKAIPMDDYIEYLKRNV